MANGKRDPLEPDVPWTAPTTFGLSDAAIRAEANRVIRDEGWTFDEVRVRFGLEPRRREVVER